MDANCTLYKRGDEKFLTISQQESNFELIGGHLCDTVYLNAVPIAIIYRKPKGVFISHIDLNGGGDVSIYKEVETLSLRQTGYMSMPIGESIVMVDDGPAGVVENISITIIQNKTLLHLLLDYPMDRGLLRLEPHWAIREAFAQIDHGRVTPFAAMLITKLVRKKIEELGRTNSSAKELYGSLVRLKYSIVQAAQILRTEGFSQDEIEKIAAAMK